MDTLLIKLGLALAIGLVVGLERGWQEREMAAGSRTAGIRTYGISGLLGGILAAVAQALSAPAVFYIGFLGFAAVFAWYQRREAIRDQNFSVTAVIAALCVFGLGGLAVAGDTQAAAAGGAGLAGLLASRAILHGLLERMSWVELRSALLLAGMTAIVLPLLPNRAIDPWGGFNPYEIWLFTVLVAAISYAGYVAVRLLGPGRGLIVSSLLGAVVSSTAVTLALAQRARAGEAATPLAGGASLAAMVSVLRVLLVTTIIRPVIAAQVALPLSVAAALMGLAGTLLIHWKAVTDNSEASHGNPFNLAPLLIFAAALTIVSELSAVLVQLYGSASVVLTSGFSGLMDVDIGVLTAIRLPAATATDAIVVSAVLLAVAANAATRVTLALTAGSLGYFIRLGAATLTAAVAGGAIFWLLPAS